MTDTQQTPQEPAEPQAPSEPQPEAAPEAPKRPTVADAIADLVQMFVDYVRQETEDIMREKVVLPSQKAGQVIAFALAAALVLFLGIGYLSVSAMMLLAEFVGWIAALAIIGAVLVAGAGGLTYAKMRSMQK